MAKKKIVVTVERNRINEVVQHLRSTGVEVSDELSNIGLVNAIADPSDIESVRKLPGVLNVEEQRDMHIAPPDSDIQ